ncbi:NAD(P)-dependent oxidoreductase [Streptomyces sp. JV176]|uniref:NAD-dependent epimerase/dehydratase family protein n=1 Tax=Streptomyces sp. JV176 TaxID=858630 RepID=UPI002E7A6C73|nr:NAD(P)-dependent oxidoreductase [Streptomyces sp. JV176]MEE1798081.1 NAD(P)-dependent oxidoreductase [Streptomyces sp. JV176]
MRLLVTGGRGKVGRSVIAAAQAAGHEVISTDIVPASYGPPANPGEPPYIRADLSDYGQVTGVLQKVKPDVVVHSAGIPSPSQDPAAVVFATNTLANFNVAEAVSRSEVARLVYISSETVPGFMAAERSFLPDYVPVDEEHPARPQDAYGLSKYVGEVICDALARRTDTAVVSVRPSVVLSADQYSGFVSRLQESSREAVRPFPNIWSYVDVEDLADLILLAAAGDTTGHEVVYAAQPDNMLGRPLGELLHAAYGDEGPPLRDLARPDASGIAIDKARRLFGWDPKRSWRDHLPS